MNIQCMIFSKAKSHSMTSKLTAMRQVDLMVMRVHICLATYFLRTHSHSVLTKLCSLRIFITLGMSVPKEYLLWGLVAVNHNLPTCIFNVKLMLSYSLLTIISIQVKTIHPFVLRMINSV